MGIRWVHRGHQSNDLSSHKPEKTTIHTGCSHCCTYVFVKIANKTKMMWLNYLQPPFSKKKSSPLFTHRLYYLQGNYKYLRPKPSLYTACKLTKTGTKLFSLSPVSPYIVLHTSHWLCFRKKGKKYYLGQCLKECSPLLSSASFMEPLQKQLSLRPSAVTPWCKDIGGGHFPRAAANLFHQQIRESSWLACDLLKLCN